MNWDYMCKREQDINRRTCGQCEDVNITWCTDCGTPLCFIHCILYQVEGNECTDDLCSECAVKRQGATE